MEKEIPQNYFGKILRVNLSNKTLSVETLEDLFWRKYIGGAGIITHFLWKDLKAGIDAFSPDNKLIFALGPFSGLTIPGAARHCVGAKSPLTGGIAKSEVGGLWAAELRRTDYAAIVIDGKAETPVYLYIEDGSVVFKEADKLWGKETKETQEAIREELGDNKVQVAQIGRAGENKVLYACIMHGLYDTAGRGGLGAVMGSKNLKAIAVRGHKTPEVFNRERLKELRQQLIAEPDPFTRVLSQFGTGGPDMKFLEQIGNLPVRNFRDGLFSEVDQIHGGIIKDTIRIGMEGCFACPIRCKKMVRVENPPDVDSAYGGPEYETLAALGTDLGIGDLKAICKGNERCNAYGLDTISTGGVIAFAMECFEKGLLTIRDTNGIKLKFGNTESMLQTIELISRREGIGDLLAEGTRRLARRIGKNSEDFAVQVKGLEAGLHDPRAGKGLGLNYMLNPTGADHCLGMLDAKVASDIQMKPLHPLGIFKSIAPDEINPRKVGLFKVMQSSTIMDDTLVTCVFVNISLKLKSDILNAITGWDTSTAEILRIAERILTTARLFNIREGFTISDDMLPKRFFEPKTDGVLSDKPLNRAEYEQAREFYYSLMGWDAKGIPLPEKVMELDIE